MSTRRRWSVIARILPLADATESSKHSNRMPWQIRRLVMVVTMCTQLMATRYTAEAANNPDTCPVYLTISAMARNIEEAQLVINWGPGCENPPAWIGLYTENPALSDAPPIVKVLSEGAPSGQVLSEVRLGRHKLPGGWSHEQVLQRIPKRKTKPICYGYYLTSYDQHDQLQYFDCLKIQPNWMFTEPGLSNVTLKDLFLPGTHCSGCYQTRANVGNVFLKKIGFRQSIDIWSQLVYGVRYLDFSIGYQPSHNGTRNFWIMNEHFRVAPLLPILQDIRRFVILSEETVFLDFRRFPLGFHNNPDQHAILLALLEQELGDLVYRRRMDDDGYEGEALPQQQQPESYNLTIGEMRREGKYLLITYNHEASLNESNLIWKPWRKHSSAFLKHTELAEFMQNLFSQKHPDAPKDVGWSLHGIQGLQGSYNDAEGSYMMPNERASIVNPKLMHLLGGPWSLRANAVLLDYFLNTNLIDMAIYTNRYKTLRASATSDAAVVLDIQ